MLLFPDGPQTLTVQSRVTKASTCHLGSAAQGQASRGSVRAGSQSEVLPAGSCLFLLCLSQGPPAIQ